MRRIINLSEASVLAFHAAGLLASIDGRMTAPRMASRLGVSEAHLSKVLQRLVKAGLLESSRGPGGGFSLKRPGEKISLLDIYELMEGPTGSQRCLLAEKTCTGKYCLFGDLIPRLSGEFEDYLRTTTLEGIKDVIGV